MLLVPISDGASRAEPYKAPETYLRVRAALDESCKMGSRSWNGIRKMVTEERSSPPIRMPTDSELDDFSELAARIKTLNTEIDKVRDRLAYRLPVTDDERAKMLSKEIELERLLVKANYFIAKFG